MNIKKYFTANSVLFSPFPFKKEFAMEAFLLENEEVLSFGEDEYVDFKIITNEVQVENAGASGDGRVDLVGKYTVSKSEEIFAIIELKNTVISESHIQQLERYLEKWTDIKTKSSSRYKDEEGVDIDLSKANKVIGIIAGPDFERDVLLTLIKGRTYKRAADQSEIPIIGLKICRFSDDKSRDVFITVDHFYAEEKIERDYTKYSFGNFTSLSKNKLAFHAISELLTSKTPKEINDSIKIAGFDGIIAKFEDVKDKKTWNTSTDMLIDFDGEKYSTRNQWNIDRVNEFIAILKNSEPALHSKISNATTITKP